MNTNSRKKLAIAFFATVFGMWQLSAHALPKAAEHEDAPVVIAADVAKPKALSKPVKKEVQKKSPPAAKTKPHPPAPVPKKKNTTTSAKK